MRRSGWAVAACAAGAAVAAVAVVPGGAAPDPKVSVVADNLNNPTGVTVAPDGSVYVAEGGTAGRTCFSGGPEGQICLGFTGGVTRVAGGVVTRPVRGLLSAGRPGSGSGVNGISVTANGTVYAIMGGFGCDAPPPQAPRRAALQLGRLLKVGPAGRLSRVANMRIIECRTNPDGTDRNPNPYGVLALGNGREVVADAGGNTLIEVQGRRSKLLTVVRGVAPRQSVPTSLALGPDGAIYVGELVGSGKKGGARVLRVVPGSRPTVFRRGFNNILGIAFGPDGSLFVTQYQNGALESRNPAGAVIKVSPDGASRTTLGLGSLFFPQGAAVDASGAVYVSNWSNLPGTPAKGGPFKGKNGQLVKITP